MNSAKKILVVEDDPNLGYVIQDNLTTRGYEVSLCVDGENGLSVFTRGNFDLCILDVMLPRKDGFTLGKAIREKSNVPILFLTAKTMLEDKIQGFEAGGDDYITKPFSLEELYYRIEVFLKRSTNGNAHQNGTEFQIGSFVFDSSNFTLKSQDKSQSLTSRESEILKLLVLNRDRILRREEILIQVWGNDDYFLGRSLDVFISKLRKYLKADEQVQITNYHGVGFRLEINS